MLQATRRVAAVACVLLALAPEARAQRPASAFLDLPSQVPDYGGFLRYGRGNMPVVGSLNSFGAGVRAGRGEDLAGVGAAAFTGETLDGTGWGVDGVLGRRLRQPFPGQYGLGLGGRLAAAYTHIPTAVGTLKVVDASAAVGGGPYVPTPFGTVELWAMPRLQLRHLDNTSPGFHGTQNSVGPGLSFGAAYISRSAVGKGVNVGGDVVGLKDPGSDHLRARWSFAVELQLLR
ncbi:MAG TPA: hypothetical protein VF832_11330 [Longimicrobiales bacterium]